MWFFIIMILFLPALAVLASWRVLPLPKLSINYIWLMHIVTIISVYLMILTIFFLCIDIEVNIQKPGGSGNGLPGLGEINYAFMQSAWAPLYWLCIVISFVLDLSFIFNRCGYITNEMRWRMSFFQWFKIPAVGIVVIIILIILYVMVGNDPSGFGATMTGIAKSVINAVGMTLFIIFLGVGLVKLPMSLWGEGYSRRRQTEDVRQWKKDLEKARAQLDFEKTEAENLKKELPSGDRAIKYIDAMIIDPLSHFEEIEDTDDDSDESSGEEEIEADSDNWSSGDDDDYKPAGRSIKLDGKSRITFESDDTEPSSDAAGNHSNNSNNNSNDDTNVATSLSSPRSRSDGGPSCLDTKGRFGILPSELHKKVAAQRQRLLICQMDVDAFEYELHEAEEILEKINGRSPKSVLGWKMFKRTVAVMLFCLSAIVLWCETVGVIGQKWASFSGLSFVNFAVAHSSGAPYEAFIVCLIFLTYIVICTFLSMMHIDVKSLHIYSIRFDRSSEPTSVVWTLSNMLFLINPACLNFISMLGDVPWVPPQYQTAYKSFYNDTNNLPLANWYLYTMPFLIVAVMLIRFRWEYFTFRFKQIRKKISFLKTDEEKAQERFEKFQAEQNAARQSKRGNKALSKYLTKVQEKEKETDPDPVFCECPPPIFLPKYWAACWHDCVAEDDPDPDSEEEEEAQLEQLAVGMKLEEERALVLAFKRRLKRLALQYSASDRDDILLAVTRARSVFMGVSDTDSLNASFELKPLNKDTPKNSAGSLSDRAFTALGCLKACQPAWNVFIDCCKVSDGVAKELVMLRACSLAFTRAPKHWRSICARDMDHLFFKKGKKNPTQEKSFEAEMGFISPVDDFGEGCGIARRLGLHHKIPAKAGVEDEHGYGPAARWLTKAKDRNELMCRFVTKSEKMLGVQIVKPFSDAFTSVISDIRRATDGASALVVVDVVEAEDLPHGATRICSPLVRCYLIESDGSLGNSSQTEVINHEFCPVWEEAVLLGMMKEINYSRLIVEVVDDDDGLSLVLGNVLIPIDKIPSGGESSVDWYDLMSKNGASRVQGKLKLGLKVDTINQSYHGDGHVAVDGQVSLEDLAHKSWGRGMLKVVVLEGSDMPALAANTTCNSFCLIKMDSDADEGVLKQQHATKTIKKALDPVYNEAFMLTVSEHGPPVVVEVYNDNLLGDQFIGRAEVPMGGLRAGVVVDKWFSLRDNDDCIVECGAKVKLRLSLVDGLGAGDLSFAEAMECYPSVRLRMQQGASRFKSLAKGDKGRRLGNAVSVARRKEKSKQRWAASLIQAKFRAHMFWKRVLTARRRLIEGITITKYGRSGAPKRRHLFCSRDLRRLQWSSEVGGRVSDSIGVDEIVTFTQGAVTRVMQRHAESGGLRDGKHLLSIISRKRTLDLGFDTEKDKATWMDLFKFLGAMRADMNSADCILLSGGKAYGANTGTVALVKR